ncbi:DUF5412 family protein [Halalkalibacter akibai]|uniref:DUF5412 domain-containing protein n=1 Tax=Halalkalibacter akibai (strain ATCC 43226 / DSM 21942 / CIP 109018 / JCM 9157 / 1139) TaxID=1236973 RepID=W4R0L2_HALA3|nr:DUF5412 family protein [Halalkalibacter akibai]GAE37712.1 hypothetical protein JCM9157_5031 [Halalkalibacter akibai JCM 9157]
MKKKKTLIKLLIIVGILVYGIYWVFFDWGRFKQELISESTSPNGTYTIYAYLNNTHATTPFTVLGELVFNNSSKRSKIIYWDKAENANILWIDDNTVEINGIIINVPNESYDFRKGIH